MSMQDGDGESGSGTVNDAITAECMNVLFQPFEYSSSSESDGDGWISCTGLVEATILTIL